MGFEADFGVPVESNEEWDREGREKHGSVWRRNVSAQSGFCRPKSLPHNVYILGEDVSKSLGWLVRRDIDCNRGSVSPRSATGRRRRARTEVDRDGGENHEAGSNVVAVLNKVFTLEEAS